MRILIVHHNKNLFGGAEEVVSQLFHYLAQNGHEVELIFEKSPWALWITTRKWIPWADIINAHNFPATLAAFPTSKPIVWMCNEPPELFTNWKRKPIESFNRWWVKRSKMKVVVADEKQAIRFQGTYGINAKVILYGVDYEFWSEGARGLPYQHGPLKLLQVGTIIPYKNQLASIMALVSLIRKGIDATLTFAGSYIVDSNYFKVLLDNNEAISRNLVPNFTNKIIFTGHVDHKAIRKLYQSHSILLHPVLEQGGWLVPFEAMSSGMPVIVSRNFTSSSLIEKNKLGIVTNDLVCGIERALKEDFSSSREWVKNNLTWEKFGENMVKVFEEATHG